MGLAITTATTSAEPAMAWLISGSNKYIGATKNNPATDRRRSSLPNFSHTITAQAYDTSGNTDSDTHTVTIHNGEVSIIAPTDGAQVSGTVAIDVSFSDDIGVDQLIIWIDGIIYDIGHAPVSPYTYYWDNI